jgi:hypothetical protein
VFICAYAANAQGIQNYIPVIRQSTGKDSSCVSRKDSLQRIETARKDSLQRVAGSKKKDSVAQKRKPTYVSCLSLFGLTGFGNFTTTDLQSMNAGVKFSAYYRPFRAPQNWKGLFSNTYVTVTAAASRTAADADSLTASQLFFPDFGRQHYSGNVTITKVINGQAGGDYHVLHFFNEFYYKKLRGTTASDKTNLYTFHTNNFISGVTYQYLVRQGQKSFLSFSFSPYVAFTRLERRDRNAFKKAFEEPDKNPDRYRTTFHFAGARVAMQYNFCQLFLDVRSNLDNRQKTIPEALKYCSVNCGLAIQANILDVFAK